MHRITIDQIIKKKFSADVNGYDPKEVDEFIDLLIDEIILYQKEIESLKNKND